MHNQDLQHTCTCVVYFLDKQTTELVINDFHDAIASGLFVPLLTEMSSSNSDTKRLAQGPFHKE